MNKHDNNQSGQIIVVLLLIVVVVLAIGLSVVGRSNTEISTASKIENSARAFSAAEAGIEHAIASSYLGAGTQIAFTNSSNSNVAGTFYPNSSVPNIEQQNIGGTDQNNPTYAFAQFWFADPKTLNYFPGSPSNNFVIWFGNTNNSTVSPNDRPAVELHIIYKNSSGGYGDAKYYIDSSSIGRSNSFGDTSVGKVQNCDAGGNVPIFTNFSTQPSPDRSFYCKATLPSPSGAPFPWTLPGSYPILLRVRVLYSLVGQPVAIGPANGTSLLPPQINLYTSNGLSGDSQRIVQVTRDTDVMPYLFDFALYSDNGASK